VASSGPVGESRPTTSPRWRVGNAGYPDGGLQERCGITRDEAEPQAAISKSDRRAFTRPTGSTCHTDGARRRHAAGHRVPFPWHTAAGTGSVIPKHFGPFHGRIGSKTIHFQALRFAAHSWGRRQHGTRHGRTARTPRREPQHLPPRRQRDPTNQDDIPARRDPERRDRRKKHVERKH